MSDMDDFTAQQRIDLEQCRPSRQSKYVVRGLKADGTEVFYTGRAGQAFIGLRSEAVGYETREAAHRRANDLNRMTKLHGVHFIAMPTIQLHAEPWFTEKGSA